MSAQEWLDRTQAITEKATPGPWETDMEDQTVRTRTGMIMFDASLSTPLEWEREDCHDAEFIAHARTALPAATAALRAVLDLHHPDREDELGIDVCMGCSTYDDCEAWPCPTITTITDTLTGDSRTTA